MIVWAGPDCAYTGSVVVQLTPLLTEYCKVEPAGQGVPVGAAMLPPVATQEALQVLLMIETFAGAVVKVGQQLLTVIVAVPLIVAVQPLVADCPVTVYVPAAVWAGKESALPVPATVPPTGDPFNSNW